jgi:4-amino-4-deoxy-L-arabinose transferase-like glycosyltransferase
LTAPPQAAAALAKPKLPAVLSALAVAGICLFSHLGALGLVGPDEPRYVWIARAMAQTGDWVTPRLYGVPWFEKPVLYYWAAAIGFDLHLPAEWAARLPSAFAALAAALAIGWLGWKHYGPAENHSDENTAASLVTGPALLAPLIFSTSVAAIGFARAATPDMLFSASITLAMACAASCMAHAGALRATENVLPGDGNLPLGTLALFGAFLGLGVLAKGPAAVILAGGAIGIWALATKQIRAALSLARPVAIAAFCVVALPWYVICARRNPDFLHVFIFQHNFERYLTPMFQHQQPFWFFGPIALLALLPWAPFLLATLPEGRRILSQNTWRTSPGFFFTCWALFPIFFFSLSQSKLPSYILPAIPPLALLLAVGATSGFTRTRALSLAISLSIAMVWLILGVVAAEYFLADPQSAVASKLILALAVLAALLSIFFGSRRNLKALVFTSAFAAAIAVEIAGFSLLPNLDSSVSARDLATLVSASPQADFYTYRLQRSWNYGLAFYAGREIKEWSPEDPGAASLLTTAQGLNELKKLGRFSGSVNAAERGVRYVHIAAARR